MQAKAPKKVTQNSLKRKTSNRNFGTKTCNQKFAMTICQAKLQKRTKHQKNLHNSQIIICKAKAQRKRSKSNEKSRANNAQMPTKVTWPGECTKSEMLKNRFLKQKILKFFF